MKHKGTVILETDRLILRRFSVDDAEAMFRNWANDPDVTKYLTWPPHADVSVSEAVNLPDTDALYSYLFSFADNVEVVEPKNIRENVKQKLIAMQQKYIT